MGTGDRIPYAVLFCLFWMFCSPLTVMVFCILLVYCLLFLRSYPLKIAIMVYLYFSFMLFFLNLVLMALHQFPNKDEGNYNT